MYSVHWLFNMEFLTFIGHYDYVGDGVQTCLITGLITGFDQCWNQCCKTSIHWRSVNGKLITIMLSDFELATIIWAYGHVLDRLQ